MTPLSVLWMSCLIVDFYLGILDLDPTNPAFVPGQSKREHSRQSSQNPTNQESGELARNRKKEKRGGVGLRWFLGRFCVPLFSSVRSNLPREIRTPDDGSLPGL